MLFPGNIASDLEYTNQNPKRSREVKKGFIQTRENTLGKLQEKQNGIYKRDVDFTVGKGVG